MLATAATAAQVRWQWLRWLLTLVAPAVTPATANTFSMLPASNASGNFTKVTQLVPVRISVNLGNQPTLLGANVEVKIKVAD